MSKRVMIIDPSKTIQILLSMNLQKAGHRVLAYSTPREAWQAMESMSEVPEVILLFVGYQRSGYGLIASVHASPRYAHTHLVALVLREERASIQRRLRHIPVSYLVKPFEMQEVLALIDAPMAASAPFSQMY
jgi:DNA-binding response OmpR family regulator